MKNRTGYPLVGLRIWPFVTSVGIGSIAFRFINFLHEGSFFWVWISMAFIIICLRAWWSDVIYEGTYQGRHTMLVRQLFRLGLKMFILSEAFFFVRFFWAWFNRGNGESIYSETPGWPPRGITPIKFWKEPLYNLAILITSGVTANIRQCYIKLYNSVWFGGCFTNKFRVYRINGLKWIGVRIILGCVFIYIQYCEYHALPYRINNGVFSSCFFVLTGFHASHVVVGTVALCVVWVRLFLCHFSKGQDIWFVKAAVWYWHFVDVVWIFVILFVYVWPCYIGKVVGLLQKIF